MTIKLQFPQSLDGTIEGISDAGIETFAGNVLDALAREQSQNSIDARAKSAQGAVQVKYELINIAATDLPGRQDLKNAITSAQKYWVTRCNKTQRALDRAAKMIARDPIPCLRISDRNTSGLTDSRLDSRGNWFNLTKASGVSEKGSGKGGSFGIGKNAFFANSVLRTVFFSTHDVEGKWAFQGVTKLVSHEVDRNKMLRATGFLGEKNFLPITNKADIPKLFQCSGTGTDIIIVGFDAKEGWREQVTAAFVENFFVAIHDGLLEVSIQREDNSKNFDQLSSVTLSNVIHALATKDERRFRPLLDFHDAMVSPEAHHAEIVIEGLGKLTLRLLLREGARKRVAMFRKTGMKIFEKDRFRTPIEFAGVFQCVGDEGNELLRRVEPPSHDRWEPDRYEEEARKAKGLIGQIYEWIRKCVNDLQIPDAGDKQAIPGLERLLPDDFEEPFDNADKSPVEGNPHALPNSGITHKSEI